jgi:hypothetical protein
MDEELYKKIIQKKEFSQLPKKDVERIFKKFDNENYVGFEKVKLTRDLLRKVFSVFTSRSKRCGGFQTMYKTPNFS